MKEIFSIKVFLLVLIMLVVILTLSIKTGKTEINGITNEQSTTENGKYEQENMLYLTLDYGVVTIKLFPDVAPKHVERIKKLTREGFYDGVSFHRVIDGFMVQTGDPTGTGRGGSNNPDLKAEFNDMLHTRGAVSMARANDPDSANSQFFIVLEDSTFLDKQYTVFGRVVDGMEYIDLIKKGNPQNNGMVENPDKIISLEVVIDTFQQQ